MLKHNCRISAVAWFYRETLSFMNAPDPSPDDQTLRRDDTECGSDRAFAELVGRHMPQGYAAADVTQTVFTDERTICNLFTNS